MTISSTNTKNSYSGDDSTVAFSYTFKILDADDIQVILRTNATGTETVQTRTTDYSVSGVGNAGGGTITFVSAPAATETVVLIRAIPLTQTTDYTPNDPFPAVTHEDALDKLTLMAQDTQEEVDRSIKLSRTNTMTSTEFTVGAATRANKIFAFDSSGELAVTQEIGTYQGTDTTTTTSAYSERDIVKSTTAGQLNNVYICVADSVAGDLLTDTDHFELLVDAVSAATSATNAATSATAAAASETAAAASESAAATSETNAATSESNASTSETNAATSETNAAASETAAAASETAAAASEAAAAASETAAAASETAAAASETAAAASESAASTSETNAAASETAAAASEAAAATSETNAATSASSAASDASAAATSAAAAAASFDAFDDIYLGAKASAPTVDNDGDALTEGDQYFNTTNNTLFVWNGSAWQAASPDIVADTTPQLGGDLDTNGNDINFGDNDKAVFGAGSDLQIYHTGAGSVIQDAGNGDLFIRGSANVQIEGSTANANMIYATEGGAVRLYYDANQKLATTSSGIDVTGTVTADGLTISDTAPFINITDTDTGVDHQITGSSGVGNLSIKTDVNNEAADGDFFINTKTTNRMRVQGGGDISFYDSTGVTQGLFWDASTQRLGLGTSSPSAKLTITESTVGDLITVTGANGTDLRIGNHASANGGVYINSQATSDDLRFRTQGSDRMTIDSSGNVLVGASSFSFSNNGTQIGATGRIFNTSNTDYNLELAGSTAARIRFYTSAGGSGTTVGSITASTTATAYNTSSDHRLKENVADMTGAIDRVKALAPKRFNFIVDADKTVDGFLAHEAQTVVPEAVTGTHNEVDDDGNPVMQGIDQSKLVPLLTGALQEAIAKIEDLETRLAALEGA